MSKLFINATALVFFGAFLSGCSSNDNQFFKTRDDQLRHGYKWQKLDKCRPAKAGASTLPIKTVNGKNLVCYSLVPPSGNMNEAPTTPSTTDLSPANLSPAPPAPTDPAPASAEPDTEPASGASGVIWKFSNY